MYERVIAEKRQMCRARAGSDAAEDGDYLAEHALSRQPVKLRGARGLELSGAVRLHWETAQSIQHQQHQFGVVGLRKGAH